MRAEWATLKRGTMASVGARGVLLLAGLATSVVLARTLSRSHLGAYFLFMQAASVGLVVGLFGTSNLIQRFVPQLHGRAVRVLLARAGRNAGLAFAGFGVLLWLAWPSLVARLETPELLPLRGAVLAFTLAGTIEEAISCYFCTVRRVRLGAFLMGIPKQLLFVAGLAAVLLAGGRLEIEVVAYLRAGTAVATTAVALLLLLRELRRRRDGKPLTTRGIPPPFGKELALIATPIAMHLLASNLLGTVDLWCIGLVRGAEEAGLYGAMMRLALLLGVLMQAVNAILPPLLSKLHAEGNRDDLENLMRHAATIGGWGALALLVAYAVAGGPIIRLFFGAGFEAGRPVLMVLAFGHAAYAWLGAGGWALQMTGHQNLMFRITLIGLAFNVGLSLVVVGPYGAIGVATVTAASMLGQALCRMAFARRLLGVRTHAFANPLRVVTP